MKADTTRGPNLNTATDELIQAVEGVTDLVGLRTGFARSLALWQAFVDVSKPDHQNAVELMGVWESLDALAAAVQHRREQG